MLLPYKTTNAISNLSQGTNIENFVLSDYTSRTDGNVFDGEQMDKLFAQITGVPNATYDDVDTAADATRDSDFFFTRNGNKAVTLKIDGIVWSAMYLSKNNSGDPILTLWQASSTQTAKWNFHSIGEDANIPSNMYSTSMIRNITLNAGGTWYETNAGGSPHAVAQDSGHTYAKFTMPSVSGSLTAFIEKPINVSWQKNEISHLVNGYEFDFNNDAYGDVGSGGIIDGKEIVMQIKVGDTVLYNKYAGSDFKLDGEEVTILRQSDVLAIVEK